MPKWTPRLSELGSATLFGVVLGALASVQGMAAATPTPRQEKLQDGPDANPKSKIADFDNFDLDMGGEADNLVISRIVRNPGDDFVTITWGNPAEVPATRKVFLKLTASIAFLAGTEVCATESGATMATSTGVVEVLNFTMPIEIHPTSDFFDDPNTGAARNGTVFELQGGHYANRSTANPN
jgi:hypothetical protein